MKHANLSIFVPHMGCPHLCSFCNQREISGASEPPTPESVRELCEQAAQHTAQMEAEIAFFGGSFTAIEPDYMCALLKAAAPFVHSGAFSGIRISTRPDRVDDKVLDLLSRYPVTAIELGAQSMSDEVLAQNRRGHTAAHVADAAARIRARGYSLGLQMMTGLYRSDEQTDLQTAQALADLKPDTMRIYPTLVMAGTWLEALFLARKYRPQTLEQATALCARLLELFERHRIRVIRMGLHAQDTLEQALVAGPYHPAFRELCEGVLMGERLKRLLNGAPAGNYTVRVAPRSVSRLTGHGAPVLREQERLGRRVCLLQDACLSELNLEIGEV